MSVMVSVPWVTTMRSSAAARQFCSTSCRSASVISRLSTIMRVRTSSSSRQRPSSSISWMWVSLKRSFPEISS